MKNPFMSAWLSAYHKNANTAKGLWTAEATRMQHKMMEDWVEMSMSFWFPWMPRDKKK